MRRLTRQFGMFVCVATVSLGLVGCTRDNGPTTGPIGGPSAGGGQHINIEGSNTVQPIAEAWQEAFNKAHPDVNITLSGAGTGTGIKSLVDGTAEICNASREISAEEIEHAKSRKVNPVATRIALDGLAVAVNSANTIDKLTLAQLRDIYLGKITDWAQLGGAKGRIAVISRDSSSGSFDFFKEHVLEQQEFAKATIFAQSTQDELNELTANKNAIAYGGLAYFEGKPSIRVVAIAKDGSAKAVLPTEAAIRSGDYPLSRPLLMYTNGPPSGIVADFINFGLSDEGQALVRKPAGYVPLK